MMIKKVILSNLVVLLILGVFLLVFSCNNQKKNNQELKIKEVDKTLLNQQEELAIKSAIDFYLWYCEKKDFLNQDNLIKVNNKEGYYSYNLEHLNFYIKTLSESGYLSKKYISNLRNMILPAEDQLKENKFLIKDELVGFEADLLLNSQDPSCLEDSSEFIVSDININQNLAKISFLLPTYEFTLVLFEGNWLIEQLL